MKGSKPKAVTVLRVVPVIPEDYQEVDEFVHVFEKEIHKLHMLDVPKSVKRSLDAGQMILEKIGIKAKVKVRKGRPVDEILKEAEEGLYNLIVMASYGKGITKDKQDKIFDRFYQVDSSTIRRYGGTGMGLAIVKEILKPTDGTINIESETDKGSSFCITLPTIKEETK